MAVTTEQIKELRGQPARHPDCCKALESAGGDFNSGDFLRERWHCAKRADRGYI
jgi:translation elongation factor EF-Ts